MSSITPKNQSLRDAVRWIGGQREERPDAKLFVLIGEAARRFDLSPTEEDALFETISAEERALSERPPESE